jgi:hypothetical protein
MDYYEDNLNGLDIHCIIYKSAPHKFHTPLIKNEAFLFFSDHSLDDTDTRTILLV